MKSCLEWLVKGFDSLFVISALLETNKLPTLEQILQKRKNEQCFFVFCDQFLSRIVGITTWKEGCTKTKVSELASVTDEAFAYLLIENYWDHWATLDVEEYKKGVSEVDIHTNKKKKRKSVWGKYTKNAYGAKRYGGWMKEGLIRFNTLYAEVKEDRLKNGEVVEENYKNHCLTTVISRKAQKINVRDVPVICDDWD